MIRKFFNVDAPVAASGGAPSIAELMATQGVMNSSENPVATPISITEVKEEPAKAPESEPAVTATSDSPAKPANPATPSPEVAVEVPTPAPIEQPEVPQPTWQEVLKNQQPDTVLKELGFDEKVVGFVKELKELDPKMVAFLEHWKSNNGDVTSYLRELTTDYSKMSAEDVMRHQLRQEYPKASPQQLDVLFNREIVKAYSLDSEDETELAEGKLLLEAKAEKYRDAFTAKQQDFLLPKPQQPKAPEPDLQEQARKQEFEAYKSQLTNHKYTQAINASKAMTFGEGDEKFNFPVDPVALTDMLIDSEKWAENLFEVKDTPQGKQFTPDVEKQMLVAMVAKYGKSFMTEYAKHYKAIGGKSAIEPIENAKPADGTNAPSPAEAAPRTAAEAMAKFGRLS